MMLAALLFLQATPVTNPADANEIVVLGERLKEWRGSFRVHDGQPACKTVRSSGDTAIDAIGCETMVQCMRPIIPQADAIFASVPEKAERERLLNELIKGQTGCLTEIRNAAIAKLAADKRAR